MEQKICSKCDDPRSLAEFQMQPSGNRRNVCNKCRHKTRRLRLGKSYRSIEEVMAERKQKRLLTEKKCTKCGKIRPKSDFSKDNRKGRSADGRCTRCKYCDAVYRGHGYSNVPLSTEEEEEERKKKQEIKTIKSVNRKERHQLALKKRKSRKQRYIRELHDVYLKSCLQIKYPIRWADFTPELLGMERENIVIKRLLKQIRKEI